MNRAPGLAWVWFFTAAATLALWPVWLPWAHGLPQCVLKSRTGIPCLSCGSTRVVEQLAEGNLAGAVAANPMACVGLILFLAGGVVAPWLWGRIHLRSRHVRAVLATVMGLLILNWIYLLVSGQ